MQMGFLKETHLFTNKLNARVLQSGKLVMWRLKVSKTKKDGPIEVKLKDKDDNLSMNTGDGGNMIPSFLQHMSMAYPDCSTAMPSVGGF
ncbi:unnamed protein product [Lactuca virosa]|uniref:Uncharacterized protein n=1 Tax=Lactuca virosa TaxID=75947 RepID=A0AAU9NLG6_9ASTR|nr:unnamed protein product [Lactuca virosa]